MAKKKMKMKKQPVVSRTAKVARMLGKSKAKKAAAKKAKTKKKKVKPIRPMMIPKDLKPFVVKKFKAKDRSKRLVVIRLPNDEGYEAAALCRGVRERVRLFAVPNDSSVPVPVWLAVQRQMAGWFAGVVARRGNMPSVKSERSRRKRFLKREQNKFNTHYSIKEVLRVVRGEVKGVPLQGPLKMLVPYICIYDPKARGVKTTFTLHMATCSRLDQERQRSVLRHNGDSWVIEARTPEEAVALQIKEFDDDDMGYDSSDFTIDGCTSVVKRVMGKTTLGRVSDKAHRGSRR